MRQRFGACRSCTATVPLHKPEMLDEGRQFGRRGKTLVEEALIACLGCMQHTSWPCRRRRGVRGLVSCFFKTARVRCPSVMDGRRTYAQCLENVRCKHHYAGNR